MLDSSPDEFKLLRRKLVEAYLQPTFDPDKAGLITEQLRTLLAEMNILKPEMVEQIRQCFAGDMGCREAARRLNVSRNTIVHYYHRFRLEPKSDKLNLGDPAPDRSALSSYKPWVPKYDDKPIKSCPTVNQQPSDDELRELPPKAVSKLGMPTADQVAAALVTASRLMGADVVTVATDYGSRNLESSRARAYAALALEELFPRASRPSVARMVGVPRGTGDGVFIANLRFRIKMKQANWFKQELVDQIKAAVLER